MKKSFTLGLFFAAALLVAGLSAQPVPTPVALSNDNLTLELKGQFGTDDPLDLSWSGVGPSFRIDAKPESTTMQITATGDFSPEGDGFRMNIKLYGSVSAVIATTGLANPTSTMSKKSVELQTSVILKLGRPVQLVESDGKVLTLTIANAHG